MVRGHGGEQASVKVKPGTMPSGKTHKNVRDPTFNDDGNMTSDDVRGNRFYRFFMPPSHGFHGTMKHQAMKERLPQPTPHPTATQAAICSQRWPIWIIGLGSFSVLCLLLIAIAPFFICDGHRRFGQTEAISNARQIGLALMEFEAEYGSYPDDSTRQRVQEKNPENTIPMGTSSSNDYFRQLIAADIAPDEMPFYTRTPGLHKPDNVMSEGHALEKGECAYAYVVGLTSAPTAPIVLFPMVRGKLLFDPKICDGKMVMLRTDGSVTSYPIDKSGHVKINGKDLFDPSQPFWGGKDPVVKWPE